MRKAKKSRKPAVPDLFSALGSDLPQAEVWTEPEPRAFGAPTVAPPPSRAIQECSFDGNDYKIEKHEDEGGEFWILFVMDAGKWRQLSLLGGDAKYIPEMLLYHAEQMLGWAAGYTDRTRDLVSRLRPLPKGDNVAL